MQAIIMHPTSGHLSFTNIFYVKLKFNGGRVTIGGPNSLTIPLTSIMLFHQKLWGGGGGSLHLRHAVMSTYTGSN